MDSGEKSPEVQNIAGEDDIKELSAVSDSSDVCLQWEDSDGASPISTLDENTKLDQDIESQNIALSTEITSLVDKVTNNEQSDLKSIEKAIAEVNNEDIGDLDEDELLRSTPEDQKKYSLIENNSLPEDILLDISTTSEKVENISNKKDKPIDLGSGDNMPVESFSATLIKDKEINNDDSKSISGQTPDSIQATDALIKTSGLDSNKLENNKSDTGYKGITKITDPVSNNPGSHKDDSVKSNSKEDENWMPIDENPCVTFIEDKHSTSSNVSEKQLQKQTTVNENETKKYEVGKEANKSEKEKTIPEIHVGEVTVDQSELSLAKNTSVTTLKDNEKSLTNDISSPITHKDEISDPTNSSSKDADDKCEEVSSTSKKNYLKKSEEAEITNVEIKMSTDEIKTALSSSKEKAMCNPDETDRPDITPLETNYTTADALDESMSEINTTSQENSKVTTNMLPIVESVSNEELILNEKKPDTIQLSSSKDSNIKSTDETTKKTSNETLKEKTLETLVTISQDSEKACNDDVALVTSENLSNFPKDINLEKNNQQDAMEVDTTSNICIDKESTDKIDKAKPKTSSDVATVVHNKEIIQSSSIDDMNQMALKCDVLKEVEKVQTNVDNLVDPKVIENPGNEVTLDKSCEVTKVTDKASIDENDQMKLNTLNDKVNVVEKDSKYIDSCDNNKVIDKSEEEITKVTDKKKKDQVSAEIISDVALERPVPVSNEIENMDIDTSDNSESINKANNDENNKITLINPDEISDEVANESLNVINTAPTRVHLDKANVVEKDSKDIDIGDSTKVIDKSEDEITKVTDKKVQVSAEIISDISKADNYEKEKMDIDTSDNSEITNKANNDENNKITLQNSDKISNEVAKADLNEKDQTDINIALTKEQSELYSTDNVSKDVEKAVKEDSTGIPKLNDDKSENQDQMTPDASDEIPKVTDSLGLLTESSRVVEEDDEQEGEDEEENDEDDDDYDHDEESNQTTLDNSEDSNDTVSLKPKIEGGISTDDDTSSDATNVLITSEAHLDTNDGLVEVKHEIDTVVNAVGTVKMSVETRHATSFLEEMLRGKRKDSPDADDETSTKKQKTDGDTISLSDASKPPPPTEDEAYAKIQAILAGVRNMTPLLDLDIEKVCDDLVEISDSDSENENEHVPEYMKIGQKGAKMLEETLADTINDIWKKFDLDDRLQNAKDDVLKQLEHVEAERKQIDDMLRDCQRQTDALRTQVYRMFAPTIKTLPSIDIIDTPTMQSTKVHSFDSGEKEENRRPRLARSSLKGSKDDPSQDDEVSVVRLRSEAPPPGLPPPGRVSRPPVCVGDMVYAMRHAFGSWLRATVTDVYSNGATSATNQFTAFRVKFVHKVKSPVKQISGRHIAYTEPPNARLTIGARVIALCKDTNTKKEAFFSGIIAEIPNPVNNYRYLVFFDDGYAQYVRHEQTRVVYECSASVWEEVHPFSMEFVRKYLVAYPERPMVRLHAGQCLKAEWNGKWWDTVVMQVDASLVQVYFKEDNHSEWIYRGSTRLAPLYVELAAKGRPRAHRATANKTAPQKNGPYVEYTRDQKDLKAAEPVVPQVTPEPRRDKQAEKVSISVADQPPLTSNKTNDNVVSRVVYFTPKAAVKPYKMTPHKCSTQCKRTDVLPLKELKTYNPLSKPLLSGWERQLVRSTGRKRVIYRAPCGRRLRNMDELHYYLRVTNSEMAVDLFDFSPTTHCLAEFELKRCHVSKKDLSLGKELVPVPCVNYYDTTLPEFCVYNTQRTPTAGVPLNLDPNFLCGCDCTDDCKDKSKCACWKMTIEGAATIGMDTTDVGYVYKRLLDPVPSGIYECNSRCKCKSTCLNRVAQHPLQLKLQVFKTLNRGWGIRALNDVPRGAFICVYVGNLLTDATANLDGLNEGDEYLAELDYIEVVEQMKQDYEEDIPLRDRILDKKGVEEEDEDYTTSEEELTSANDTRDDDFQPDRDQLIGFDKSAHKKSLRKRKSKNTEEKGKENAKEKEKKGSGDDCITISDDEEVREPSRFSAPTDMGVANFVPKYKSVRSYFGEDEAVYTMDAKVQGNIGRYLNHSCAPNVFVQNVFVDTHDPRFPWVSFFALSYIRAGTELTWNYNYDIGSVRDKVLYCYCSAPNCRGRLL